MTATETIARVVLAALLCTVVGCAAGTPADPPQADDVAGAAPHDPDPARPEETPMIDDGTIDMEAELQRVRILLGPDRAGDLAEVDPLVPAEAVGADAALGFRSKEFEAQASVYVFAGGGGRAQALEVLRDALPEDEQLHVVDAVNGPSLFFGYTSTAGEDGIRRRFGLNDLLSAFAGDE